MPTGGKKDTVAPKLVSVTPADSMRNTRPSRIDLTFDEYIVLADAMKEVKISPLLEITPVVTSNNKKVTIKIADSLLEKNTTYRITLGNAVKDLHEGNVFPNYSYTFSTGAYFDSLTLAGKIIRASTGLPDSAGINVVLYYAEDNDSAIVKHKPKYITKVETGGSFIFKGLPARKFKIFALGDKNDNLMYDGPGEAVAFTEQIVQPGDSVPVLRTFELPDTNTSKTPAQPFADRKGNRNAESQKTKSKGYTVNADTTISRRTFGLDDTLRITLTDKAIVSKEKITLLKDTGATQSAVVFNYSEQMLTDETALKLYTPWQPNALYTLKLAKGFAKDSSGTDYLPSRYTFRTREDEDYGKIRMHLPTRFADNNHVLLVLRDQDTVYQRVITDTLVSLVRLVPASYVFRVITDVNHNGHWDSGSLLEKRQPEEVTPYTNGPVILKAGWENDIDFDPKTKAAKSQNRW